MSRGVLDFKEVNELLLASVDYNDLYLPSGKVGVSLLNYSFDIILYTILIYFH